jgi:transposase InsO family protein
MVSRASYYRYLAEKHPEEEDMEVRAAMQQIYLQHRGRYGRPRITAELRNRGMKVNHKRVGRLMRLDNLLAIGSRKFVRTTDSSHSLEVSINVAAHMQLMGVNQLWVADITYIRLRGEFVFLAVVLDRYSRQVVGWSLERTLSARLTVVALERAIQQRRPAPGLVHHSDRGVQYAAHQYVALLHKHGIVASMSRPGNPYDNAACERFMLTLKQEEIHCREYRDLPDLEAHVGDFLENYYNRQRLHSALNYQTPEQFEMRQAQAAGSAPSAPKMSFSRHEEIYRSDAE